MDAYLQPEGCEFFCPDCAPSGAEAYPDGGGEADCPQHCANCHEHLENPLTSDGYNYVHEKIADYFAGKGSGYVLREWADYYDVTLESLFEWAEKNIKV